MNWLLWLYGLFVSCLWTTILFCVFVLMFAVAGWMICGLSGMFFGQAMGFDEHLMKTTAQVGKYAGALVGAATFILISRRK